MTDASILIVAAVIEDGEGRVLLVRKRGTAAFIQPGGKREAHETSIMALERELVEELGVALRADSAHYLGKFEDVAANEIGRRVRAEAFVVSTRGTPVPAAEIEEVVWIAPEGNPEVLVAPLTANHIFPSFIEHRRRRTKATG